MPDRAGRLWRRLLVLLRWRRHQDELREEIAQHHALRQRAFEAQGMSPGEAAAAASRAMGNMTVERERSRRVWSVLWLGSVWRDLLYALRSLRRQPLFAAVAILGLAGGLGFSASAFSAFNAMVLRAWELPEADRLVTLYATSTTTRGNRRDAGFSYDQLATFAARAQSITDVFAFERTRPDGTGSATVGPVSADYFTALRVPMALGRGFRPEEDRIGAPSAVIVLGYDWWRLERDSSPDVIGTVERVRGVPFTVVGVAAPGFAGTDFVRQDAWIPLAALPLIKPKDATSRGAMRQSDICCVQAAARLAPGVSRDDAAAEITALLAQTMRPGIDTLVRRGQVEPFTMVGSAGPTVRSEILPTFAVIFGGVAVVLLLACANVGNLLLACAATRERELGIRLALGASRGRIVRQLMTESLVLALLAGIPAVALASWLPAWIIRIAGGGELLLVFTPDWRVLVVTFALAVASCVAFGLAPALQATKPHSGSRARVPLRAVFLSTQVTFCVVLLVAAGLFVRSATEGRAFDPGFVADGVSEVLVTLPVNEDEGLRARRLEQDLPALAEGANLRSLAFVEYQPMAPGVTRVRVSGEEVIRYGLRASPEYFAVMRMTMLAGRPYGTGAQGANEIVINALMAEDYGGPSAALGTTVVVDSVARTVVGVVRTARDAFNLRDARPMLYEPFRWTTAPRVLLRGTPEEARRLADALRARDASIGTALRPFQWYVDLSLASAKSAATMAGALGLLALTLASVGIFGVFSFWVQQRRHDIGVRLALGASRGRILRIVLGASGRAIGWGLGIGLVLSVLVAMGLRSWLYGLSPLDPATFGAALGILLSSATLATVLPAWRAMHVDPMESLRVD